MGRSLRVAAICIALTTMLAGCPASTRVVGIWQLNLFEDCDNSVDGQVGLVLQSNGTAQIYPGAEFSGIWEVNGTTITIDIVNPYDLHFTGAVALNSNAITDGTYSAESSNGCWDAERIQI